VLARTVGRHARPVTQVSARRPCARVATASFGALPRQW
jgi:hypothetical protein